MERAMELRLGPAMGPQSVGMTAATLDLLSARKKGIALAAAKDPLSAKTKVWKWDCAKEEGSVSTMGSALARARGERLELVWDRAMARRLVS